MKCARVRAHLSMAVSAYKPWRYSIKRFASVSETMWSLLVLSSNQRIFSSPFALLSFKLVVITSHVVALHFSILWGSFAVAKGIETKSVEGGRRGWNTDAFLPSDSISFKTSPNKWLFGINLVKRFLFPNDWIASTLICLWMRATFLLTLYLTQQELMELLWWWCMGDCARRQMGKCNYECFRASGRKEKNCHKGEFKKQRQHHSSCETIVRKN